MAFKPPPAILQRVMRFKSIQHKNGKLLLWNIPAILIPAYSFIFLQRLMENDVGRRKASSVLYALGKFQSIQTFKMVSERFGYAKTINDKRKLLEFNTGQSEVAGLGTGKWIRIDLKNKVFILRGRSTIAEEYRRFFGLQKLPVDYFIRGCLAAYAEAVSEAENLFCIETSCISMGKKHCEFVIKEKTSFDKNEVASQDIDTLPSDIRMLGSKIEPYLALANI